MTPTNEQYFYAIVGNPPARRNLPIDPRRLFGWPTGTIAAITRMIDGRDYSRLHVQVLKRFDCGIILRCPIGLQPDEIYRLQVGSDPDDAELIQIMASRPREDGGYDVGATAVESDARRIAA